MLGYCIMTANLTRQSHLDPELIKNDFSSKDNQDEIKQIKQTKVNDLTNKLSSLDLYLDEDVKNEISDKIEELEKMDMRSDWMKTYYAIDKHIDVKGFIAKYGHLTIDSNIEKRRKAVFDFQRNSNVSINELPKNLQSILNSVDSYTGNIGGKRRKSSKKRSKKSSKKSKKRSKKSTKKRSTKKRSTKK